MPESDVTYFVMFKPDGPREFDWVAIGGPWTVPEPARKLKAVMDGMSTPRRVEFVTVGDPAQQEQEKTFSLLKQKRIEHLLTDYHSSRGEPESATALLDALDDWLGVPTSIEEGRSR